MARHVIQIPINKSSNSAFNVRIYAGNTTAEDEWLNPPRVSNKLYSSYTSTGGPTGIGFGWDSSLLEGKQVVSARLYYYSLVGHSRDITYRYTDFIEGEAIPSRQPSDGVVYGGASTGWDYIDIGVPVGNSIVLEADLRSYTGPYGRSQVEYWEMNSHRNATNKPYLEITYDDLPPSPPTMLSPNNTEVNRKEVIRFSWRHNSNEGYHQKGFTLQYSTNNGTTWTTITRTTSSQYYDLPANTFTQSGTVLWKVKTIDGNDGESNFSTTATFDVKTPPNRPTLLSPSGVALNPRNIIKFTWKHNSVEGLTQKGFVLEYSTDDGSNWTTVNQTTSNQYYDLPANKLPLIGTVQWRIKTIDGNNLSSENATASFTLKTPPDNPTSLYPNNITLNPRETIKFSWLHNSNSGLGQKGFTLQYSINGGSTWTVVSETGTNQFYDMPANTLPTEGTVLWKVMTVDGNGDSSGYTSASFALGTPPQQAPIPIQPVGAYLDSTEPILFEWHFMGGTPGETQKKYDLQYSINGGSTWTTITETTSNKFKELPANTFNITGNITWRVRTYNNFDEVSPYSDNKTFYVISSPPIPQITSVSNNARPAINWTSQGQHVYEIQIIQDNKVIIDTGAIPSVSDREYKLKEYLKDGDYKVRLRVINEYNLYSPWSEKSFTISTVKPQKPIIAIYGGEYSITIKASNLSSKNLVYRDNILLGELIDDTFVDYTCENKKEHQYFIRSINSSDNFNDSDIKLASCKFSGNTLALANNPQDFIKLKTGFGSMPRKTNQFGISGNLNYYDGRKYPVTEFSEFDNKAKTLSFFVSLIEEVEKIEEMIKARKTFLYRNNNGRNIYGTILGIDYDETMFGYEIGFTITQTDYKGVRYD